MRRVLITGGAGFIGSNLGDRLLADGVEVVVYDNFTTGQRRFVEGIEVRPRGEVVEGDVLDGAALREAMAGCDTVFHLAANADVRFGLEDPSRDFEQNTVGHLHRARGDAGGRRAAHRLRVVGLGLRRARGGAHARGRPVPGPDVALRRLEAGRRGA